MSAEDRISRQSARLYFREMDHVALFGSFADTVEHIDNPNYYSAERYYGAIYMKGSDVSKRDLIWRKFFPDKIFVLPWDSSSVQYMSSGMVAVYPEVGCMCQGCGVLRYDDRRITVRDDIGITTMAGSFSIYSRGESYSRFGTNELIITLEDGRTRVTYKPKLYMGPKWLGAEYTEGVIGFKQGIVHTVTDYPNDQVHWVWMKFTDKKKIDPVRDDVIVSEVDCGLKSDILHYRQQQVDFYGNISYYDAQYTYYSDQNAPNLLLTETQYYTDRNRTYFRTMSPTGGKSGRLGFFQSARGNDSPVMCQYYSLLDVAYCNGRWVVAVYHESSRGPGSVGVGHLIAVYALNSGGLQKLYEINVTNYNSSPSCRILYKKGMYYIYISALQNGYGGTRNMVRILYGSALSHLRVHVPSGLREVPMLFFNGEEQQKSFTFIMDGEYPGDYTSDDNMQYATFSASHIHRMYNQSSYENGKNTPHNWLLTTGPSSTGWWNHGGYCMFKDHLMHDSEDNWGFREAWCEGGTDQYIWQAYYEPEEEEVYP